METTINKRLPLINIFLITAISFLSVDTKYKIFAAELNTFDRSKPILSTNNFKPASFNAPPLSQYSAIVERNIFQAATSSVAPAEEMIVDNIKPSDRNLRLWGTVVAMDLASAYAIIEKSGMNSRRKEQSLYRRGDMVQGAEIKKFCGKNLF